MRIVKLGEITENLDNRRIPLNSKERAEKGKEKLYPYIGANNVLDYISEYIFDEKILCVAEDGGSWGGGEVCAKIYTEKCWVNNHAHVLRAKPSVILEYLSGYLNYANLNSYITGATRGKLTKSKLDAIPIPLPPLDDQIRIAHLLSKVEGLIAQRKHHLQQLDELLKSVFLEMFGDPVRNERGWVKMKVSEFATVKIGPFGSLLHAEDYISGGIPLVNPSHIIGGEVETDESLTITDDKFNELSAYHLKINDLVVARRGEIGRCALVRTNSKLLCGTGSMFIRISDEYLPAFLQFMIFRTSLKDYLESKAKGVTMKNLNSSILEDMQVINPSLKLQNQFAAVVEKVEGIKARYQQSLAELENLYGVLR